ncbi:hypothetical protein LX36DRAFT_405589 [Colletotrichum falcatum]|nr:hypothetical protein LX36DRAFT_405589 [Colletotrichum falcatum]
MEGGGPQLTATQCQMHCVALLHSLENQQCTRDICTVPAPPPRIFQRRYALVATLMSPRHRHEHLAQPLGLKPRTTQHPRKHQNPPHTCPCEDPLVIVLEPESDEEGQTIDDAQTVPDDLELPCGCHFHWQCLLDLSQEIAISLNCPSCQKYLPSNAQGPSVTNPFLHTPPATAIITRYVNEGGLQDALDILPNITEEAYLASNPDARPARAYHLMCAEGDVQGVVDLLQDANEELAGDVSQLAQLIRYQDPLAGGMSALHLALDKEHQEVVWLLLWIASPLPTDLFPLSARQAAEALQIVRLTNDAAQDIRALRTDAGQTAEDVARAKPARWGALVDAGILRP